MSEIVKFLEENKENMLKDLEKLVTMESPSTDKDLLDKAAEYIASYGYAMLGVKAEIIQSEKAGNKVIFRIPGNSDKKQLLLLSHFDTVWPKGTLERIPFKLEEGVITGPGVFDMKGGLIQGIWALKAAMEKGRLNRPVALLCTSDEETGSESSRKLIEEEASKSEAVLVLEASQNGMLKTGRKGVGAFRIFVQGKASHSGLDPEKGISAIEELARIILDLHSMTDLQKGTTVNVGVIKGGTRPNVIAAEAQGEVDLRIATMSEANRVIPLILNLEPHNKAAKLRIEGGLNRPPMERTEGNLKLFALAKEVGKKLGMELEECTVGGGSDGNFCSALGIPVLDGIGTVGGGAHAENEHLLYDTMPLRAALVAELIGVI